MNLIRWYRKFCFSYITCRRWWDLQVRCVISIGAHATIDNNASSSARASFLQQILDLTDLTLSSGDCSLIDFFICFCWSFFWQGIHNVSEEKERFVMEYRSCITNRFGIVFFWLDNGNQIKRICLEKSYLLVISGKSKEKLNVSTESPPPYRLVS